MASTDIVRTIETELSRNGISKGQFYKDCDVSSATFSQWRSGTYYPSLSALKRIAEYLHMALAISPDGYPTLISTQEEKEKEVLPDIEPASDEQLKFALFKGADVEITDAMLDKVKEFARMVAITEAYEHHESRGNV